MYKDITGIILSGGKSSRMGLNKSLIELSGKTFIQRTKDLMSGLFENVILITNEPDLYDFLDIESYVDIFKGFGPLGGIHSGLINSKTEENFIISCDIPLVIKDAITFIADYPAYKAIKIPKAEGYIQQLCGIYSKKCLPEIESVLNESMDEETRDIHQRKRKCKVHKLIDIVDVCLIDFEEEFPNYTTDIFFNMNNKNDYEYVKMKYE